MIFCVVIHSAMICPELTRSPFQISLARSGARRTLCETRSSPIWWNLSHLLPDPLLACPNPNVYFPGPTCETRCGSRAAFQWRYFCFPEVLRRPENCLSYNYPPNILREAAMMDVVFARMRGRNGAILFCYSLAYSRLFELQPYDVDSGALGTCVG